MLHLFFFTGVVRSKNFFTVTQEENQEKGHNKTVETVLWLKLHC